MLLVTLSTGAGSTLDIFEGRGTSLLFKDSFSCHVKINNLISVFL